MDFWISDWISGFHSGFLDFTVDFWISAWISGFLDFSLDFCRRCTRFLSWRTPRYDNGLSSLAIANAYDMGPLDTAK